MRNIDERMAEIARRSEKRIQARKKRRNRLIAVCIPMILCVGLFVAAATVQPQRKMSNGIEGENGQVTENEKVLVQKGTEQCAVLTDIAQMDAVYKEINALLSGWSEENVSPESTKGESYTITFFRTNGAQIVFTLDGTSLRNVTAGRQQILTEQQLANLKQMLGLLE
jgi:hypothetical protein